MITCMFTGHRPQNLPFRFNEDDFRCQELKRRLAILIREKIENGITCFLSGMAIGVDCYAAEIVLSLKKEFPNISLYAIVPCSNQSCKWNDKQIARYNSILKQCDKVITLQETYTPDCMQKRNRYMVEHSDCVIAVWNGTSSGTSSTVKYAIKNKLPVTVLHPNTYSVQNL